MMIILSQRQHQDLIARGYQTQSQETGESEIYINYSEKLGHAYRWRIDLRLGF